METPLVKVTDGIDPKSHMLPIKLSFPLGKLKPGEYDCEVTILDPSTQKTAFWQSPRHTPNRAPPAEATFSVTTILLNVFSNLTLQLKTPHA
jgi:hypothetical protein